jgi:hypothetical protein
MAIIKHTAMNLLTQAKPTTSLKNRRKKAGWNADYLEKIIRRTAWDIQAISLGDARQRIGEAFALVDDVKDIAMARRVAPGGLLPGTQTPARHRRPYNRGSAPAGQRRTDARPRYRGVTVVLRGQEIAIGRLGAEASQNRLSAVEELIVQPGSNARQVLRAVDHAGLLSGRVEHVVNGADDLPSMKLDTGLPKCGVR